MNVGIAQKEPSKIVKNQEGQAPDYISWEDFEKNYLLLEDGFRYEWLNGAIEKTPTMNKTQLFILRNLQRFFMRQGLEGLLIAEADLHFKNNHRRPDICWLTDTQIDNLADNKAEVPAFVIEVISTNDVLLRVAHKMQDYRAADVKVVWHILPSEEEVHIYAGKNLDKMTICRGNKICSAAPVLNDFKIQAKEIFKKGK